MKKNEKTVYLEFLNVFLEINEAALSGAICMLENIYSSPEDVAFAWAFHGKAGFERRDLFGSSGKREVIFVNSRAM